jgi:uncharacterized protein YigA (DUF484 family)
VNPTVVAALVAAVGAVIGAVIGAFVTLFIQSRKLPADIRLTEAQAEKTQHEASNIIIDNLVSEVARLKDEVKELKEEIKKLKALAENANEFRIANHVLGRKLTAERSKVEGLAEIISGLLESIEQNKTVEIKRQDVTRLVAAIINGYPSEGQ